MRESEQRIKALDINAIRKQLNPDYQPNVDVPDVPKVEPTHAESLNAIRDEALKQRLGNAALGDTSPET